MFDQTDYAAAFALIENERPRERASECSLSRGREEFRQPRAYCRFRSEEQTTELYQYPDYVTVGALIAHGIDWSDLFLRLAAYVDRILKGAKSRRLAG